MNSTVLATTHLVSVNIFLLIYLVKTILLFSNSAAFDKFTKATKVIEMIVSTIFLATGIWLIAIVGAIKMFQIIKLGCVLIAVPLAITGFRKKNKALALVSFILIIGAYGLAEMAKNKPYISNKVVVTGNSGSTSETGIELYAGNCAMCHGLDGKKKYRDAADLSSSVLDASLIPQLVKEGSKGKMPAFSGTLSDEETNAVAAYILTLRGK